MLGAIIGDIVGSRFEMFNVKLKNFELFTPECCFTDDSIMTFAIAKAILECEDRQNLGEATVRCMQELGRRYFNAGYGGYFRHWLRSANPQPYNSWGNGAAMRVSACGFVAKSEDDVIDLSRRVTEVTHNHPEGIKGAEAVAMAIFMARTGTDISEIQRYIHRHYYSMDFTLDDIRESYQFDVSCQGSVPQALKAFFESTSFEDTIRNAISIGGDSDTVAAMAGGVAQAYYGIPDDIREQALKYLREDLMEILTAFETKYLS